MVLSLIFKMMKVIPSPWAVREKDLSHVKFPPPKGCNPNLAKKMVKHLCTLQHPSERYSN